MEDMQNRLHDNEVQVGKLWGRVKTMEQVIKGNGGDGHAQRIAKLEEWRSHCGKHCEGAVLMKKHLDEIEKREEKIMGEKERKRGFRIGDIANFIAASGVIVVIILFILGGG
jgi:tetrahydromethanopterin S-methyltransferase subunit G